MVKKIQMMNRSRHDRGISGGGEDQILSPKPESESGLVDQ